jgi:acetylornithine deacetylase/succinyl-diaminopimelate desuccinylase-like protein
VNIQFLWELEEEIGSPNFERGLAAAIAGDAAAGRAPFGTDAVVVSDTIWIAAGRPAIPYGLRGLMGFTVALQTGAKDVHSGTTGGAARNPVTELCGLVAACIDARTGKVKIPGFYDEVRKLTAEERKAFARAGFSSKRFKAAHELSSLRPHKDDLAVMASIMAQPTFEVHGLVGGYSGPGIKTIVPHKAELKLSTRLVPDQRPAKVFQLVKRFIKKQLPDAVVTHEASLEPVPRAHRRAAQRGGGRGHARDLRARAGLLARRRVDRRRADDAPPAQGARHLHGSVAARARLPRRQRELRLGPGLGRDGDVLPLFP